MQVRCTYLYNSRYAGKSGELIVSTLAMCSCKLIEHGRLLGREGRGNGRREMWEALKITYNVDMHLSH